MRFSRVLLPAFLAIVPVIAHAQNRERTTVEVVQVPVSVIADGSSVRGLTRDDFTVRVNGNVQPIDYFDVIDFAALANEQLRDPRQRRLYVLAFDLANSSSFAMFRARRAAEEYLANAQPSDYFAVALLERYGDINLILPFTRDRDALRRAVATFRAASPKDPLRLTVTPAERAVFTYDNSAEIEQLRRMGASVAADAMIEAMRNRVGDELNALGDLALRMAPLEGFKHVVLLSSGFSESILIAKARLTPSNLGQPPLEANRAPAPISFDSHIPFAQLQMQKKFAAAGVFLDAVDLTGVPPYNAPYNDSLHYLIADTGGQVIEHRNDLVSAMKRLTDSEQVVYLLSFRAPKTGRNENAISVRVAGAPRGSNVAYRHSYSSTPDKLASNDGLRLADIIINDVPQNGITMTTAVSTAPKRATVNVTLPGREVAALAGAGGKVEGEALIYIFAGQKAVAFAHKKIDVRGNRAGNTEMTQSFDLPPGTYAMKVLVSLDNDTFAFARKDFTIGE